MRKEIDGIPEVRQEPSFRERQVLDLIMKAYSNKEIAHELGIEERTVKSYVTTLMRKSGVDNRVALSVQALRDSRADRGQNPA
jgi:DNA-binding NarL/FixJ family response regulator